MSGRSLALCLGAECLLGMRLVTRNRAVRLVMLLVATLVAMAVLAGARGSGAAVGRLTFVACGSLMAVAASRVLAAGAILAAGRRAAAPGCVLVLGRMAGVALLVGPIVVGTAILLVGPVAGWEEVARVVLVAWGYVGAVGTLALMLGPFVGGSGAASVTLLLVWLGGIPPSGMRALLEAWPHVQQPIVWLWNVLPLAWRASRLHGGGEISDALLLAGWVVVALVVAAWAAARLPPDLGRGAS